MCVCVLFPTCRSRALMVQQQVHGRVVDTSYRKDLDAKAAGRVGLHGTTTIDVDRTIHQVKDDARGNRTSAVLCGGLYTSHEQHANEPVSSKAGRTEHTVRGGYVEYQTMRAYRKQGPGGDDSPPTLHDCDPGAPGTATLVEQRVEVEVRGRLLYPARCELSRDDAACSSARGDRFRYRARSASVTMASH